MIRRIVLVVLLALVAVESPSWRAKRVWIDLNRIEFVRYE